MKKLIALISVIACIFGLTACGSEEQYTEYEQQKIAIAEQIAAEEVVPMMEDMTANNADILKELTYLHRLSSHGSARLPKRRLYHLRTAQNAG